MELRSVHDSCFVEVDLATCGSWNMSRRHSFVVSPRHVPAPFLSCHVTPVSYLDCRDVTCVSSVTHLPPSRSSMSEGVSWDGATTGNSVPCGRPIHHPRAREADELLGVGSPQKLGGSGNRRFPHEAKPHGKRSFPHAAKLHGIASQSGLSQVLRVSCSFPHVRK